MSEKHCSLHKTLIQPHLKFYCSNLAVEPNEKLYGSSVAIFKDLKKIKLMLLCQKKQLN